MNVLVTGGLGYIGSHTCVALLNAGYDVMIIDNLCRSQRSMLERISRICGREPMFKHVDLRNLDDVKNVFSHHKIDAVIQFAAHKSVPESIEDPLLYYENNVAGLINLCLGMAYGRCQRLIFSSSAAVYATATEQPVSESVPVSAFCPYAHTKVMGEQIIRDMCAANPEMSAVILRYFNPIGAHESGLIGEGAKQGANLMSHILKVATGLQERLYIYGGDYPTPDGTGIRDYLHVCDLAAGHISALNKTFHSNGVRTYNLGTGRGVSVLELIHAFEAATGVKIAYEIVPRRVGDIAMSWADSTLALKELGWKTEFDLDRMCRDAWRFECHNKG